jgi:hypothetical protein
MNLDGDLAEAKVASHLLVESPLGYERHDLALTRG